MSNALTKQSHELIALLNKGKIPWCEKCNKPVEFIDTDNKLIAYRHENGALRYRSTGKTITLKCHGDEAWFDFDRYGRLLGHWVQEGEKL